MRSLAQNRALRVGVRLWRCSPAHTTDEQLSFQVIGRETSKALGIRPALPSGGRKLAVSSPIVEVVLIVIDLQYRKMAPVLAALCAAGGLPAPSSHFDA